jgi:hypothetical protein
VPGSIIAAAVGAIASAGAASALAGTAFATAIGAFGVKVVAGFAGGVAAAGISAAFGARSRKPQESAAATLQSRMLSVRQPIAAREIVYGEARKGGVIVYIGTARGTATALTTEGFVVPAAPHQVRLAQAASFVAIESVQLVDVIADDALIAETFTPLAAVGGTPGPGQYSIAGGVVTLPESAVGRNVRISYHHLSGVDTNQRLIVVYAMADHQCEGFTGHFFDDEELVLGEAGIAGGRYAGHVQVLTALGAPDQAAMPFLLEALPDWTAAHRLRGITYTVLSLWWNPDIFPGGLPNYTGRLRGRRLYDPRSGLTAWSDNWALCVADYLADSRYGMRAPYASAHDTAQLVAAANICDEAIALASGGSERRFTCNGVLSSSPRRRENLEVLLSAGAGRAVKVGGLWRVLPAAYTTPTVTLTERDLRGALRVNPLLPVQDLANGIKGVYTSPANAWQPADFPALASATFAAQDGGERIWRDIDLPFTTSGATAQRIAKIELLRTRQQITVSAACRLSAYRLRAGDFVYLTLARYGWVAKPFEVVESAASFEAGNIGVDLLLRATAATVFAWSSSEEQAADPAPNTGLADPFVVAAPGVPAVAESLYETSGSVGVRTRVRATWAASSDGQAAVYELQWQQPGAERWASSGELRSLGYDIDDLAAGVYDFRVRARSAIGHPSLWAQTRREILGLTARPADVTGLTLQAISSLALLYWDRHPDLDVRIGGRIHVRHSEALTGATWEASYSVVEPLPGDSTVAALPLKSGTYLLRAADSTGQFSEAAALATTRAGTVLNFATVGTPVQEDPTFPGTKSGVVVSGSNLTLSGSGMWDSIADVDAVSNIDGFGGFTGSGTYTFAAGIDLGSVKRVQLRTTLAMQVVQSSSLIDSRTDFIDDWLDVDGAAAGGVGDCVIEVRETDDDPGGTPVWSEWRRLITADYTARAFQFRARLSCTDPAYNVQVSQLRVTAKEVV